MAERISVPAAFISQIVKGTRPVPTDHCAAIEQATSRAVMRWDLRPDDWWRIWPELIGQPGAPAIPEPVKAA